MQKYLGIARKRTPDANPLTPSFQIIQTACLHLGAILLSQIVTCVTALAHLYATDADVDTALFIYEDAWETSLYVCRTGPMYLKVSQS